jgi:large subunit ribosomal protein L22
MTQYNYSTEVHGKDISQAVARDVPVSRKQGIEIANYIRGKKVKLIKKLLNEVIQMKKAVPFRRYNQEGAGHKTGIGPGRYPIKATGFVLDIIKNAENNAKRKGLNTDNLILEHINIQQGTRRLKYGRKGSRISKRSHIEIVVKDLMFDKKTEEKSEKKIVEKEEKKVEEKKVEEKKEKKETVKKEDDVQSQKVMSEKEEKKKSVVDKTKEKEGKSVKNVAKPKKEEKKEVVKENTDEDDNKKEEKTSEKNKKE